MNGIAAENGIDPAVRLFGCAHCMPQIRTDAAIDRRRRQRLANGHYAELHHKIRTHAARSRR